MADINGFLKIKRKDAGNRPINERVRDHSEVEQVLNSEDRMLQAARCMDCGIPFCHWSCPVDNLIPEWNDLLYKADWKGAYMRLASTNNFPEFTGRICPASCEHACVLNINQEPVTIRENEVAIVEKAFAEGYIKPEPPKIRTGKTIAVIGSGPSGMAAADLLNKTGHTVTLFEKDEKAGGLLRFGIPDFKLSKSTIDRRLNLMIAEGLIVKTGVTLPTSIPIISGTLRVYKEIKFSGNNVYLITGNDKNLYKLSGSAFVTDKANLILDGEYISALESTSNGILLSVVKTLLSKPQPKTVSDVVFIQNQ